MNRNKKVIVGATIFILCFIVGFFASHFLYGDKGKTLVAEIPEKGEAISQPISASGSESSPQPSEPIIEANETSSQSTDSLPEPEIIVEKIKRTGSTYSLKVKCENVPENMIVSFSILDLDLVSESGDFKRIPGISSGEYTVTAFNIADQTTIARKKVSGFAIVEEQQQQVGKMSASEFQSLLLNQSDNSLLGGRNPKVALYVSLKCVGLREDDFPANDIQHVRDKIANGIWKSASVTSVGYNERGQINSATISPVY